MAEDESFKVTDRRGRSADASNEPEPMRRDEPRDRAQMPPAADTGRIESADRSAPPSSADSAEADLQGLFITLGSSALINLGEAPNPATGQRSVDLEQAREAIDLLQLLRNKTNGNRTDEESRLLEDLLYDLQMRFVHAAKSTPSG